ncbi:hypothetical protein KTO58_27680 [Chitinophaga pendula]|uniref:hypothetical protein n=1 Tax=Chitinophaga TaxID=79328 RepID=UPI000BAFFB7A|nr:MULTISPECIES: hypothetical protein [Chitinophaga]ASZ09663.1 hypothetical protein CK934_01085 [Chitinophaga sp. MD30]UCJ07398.1 hypothetical protein KTO58_27680 [Chitinophaga pendula]
MQSLKYFTQEGNVYTKKPQTVFIITLALFLFLIVALILIKGAPTTSNKVIAGFVAFLGVILFLRTSGKLRISTGDRTLRYQPFFFSGEQVFSFDDFENFLISKQSFLITMNATASIILYKNGKKKMIMLHQSVFVTKPLQVVIEETSKIMGIPT